MSTATYRGLPINYITDKLVTLNGTSVNQAVLDYSQASGGNYWPQSGGDDLWNLCFIATADISATFEDTVTGLEYTVESAGFVGPRPSHHPHVS